MLWSILVQSTGHISITVKFENWPVHNNIYIGTLEDQNKTRDAYVIMEIRPHFITH